MTAKPISPDLAVQRLAVRILEAPLLDDTVPMSFAQLTHRRVCLVELEADGVIGVGESWINYPPWAPAERVATLCDGAADAVLGREVSDPVATHRALVESLVPLGRQWGAPGPIWQAISGIDLAVWDLAGKATGAPVAHLLTPPQGIRWAIPAYGSGVGPTEVTRLCERAMELGLPAIKVKVGFDRETDTATLREARDVIGDRLRVFADANQAWEPAAARDMCRLLADSGVEWVEEPLIGDDIDALEKLSRDSSMSLATGENLYGRDAFVRYIASPAVAQIQPDLSKSGGLTLARDVADRAAAGATGLSPHCYSGPIGIAASLQLGAASRAVDWVELDLRDNPLRTGLLCRPLNLTDGGLEVPDGPGLGVKIHPETVRRYEVHQQERRAA